MTSPFRTNPSLGPNLHQTVTSGTVWYDNPTLVSPVVGDASAAIAAAAAPGTQVTITEPAMTAAAGAGGFYAPVAGVAINTYFWARKSTL
jgi:hypothetical protein